MQRSSPQCIFALRCLLVLVASLALVFLAHASYAAAPAPGPSAPTSAISFGQTVTGSIALSAQTDSYTFSAAAGDVVLSRMARTSSTLYPRLRLYGPGAALAADSGFNNMNYARVEITATLATGGSYTLMASNGDGGSTGGYSLTLQRVNDPGSATSLIFNHVVTATVASGGQLDTYTFAAGAGDVVLGRASRASGDLRPQLRLYAPGGTLLKDTGYNIDWGLKEITATLPAAGSYTLIVSDGDGRVNPPSTGNYGLSLQHLNDPGDNPGHAAAIAFNRCLTETISTGAETDAYTFAAAAGDVVLSRMARTNFGMYPRLRLYAPAGALLADSGYNYDYGRVEVTATLAAGGSYTLLASNGEGGTTGAYSLSLQHVNNPGDNRGHASAITFGRTVTGTVAAFGDTHAYTFAADAGGVVLSRMARTCCGLYPQIRLYAPGGALLKNSGGNVDFASREITSTLPITGSYTLIASNGDARSNLGSIGGYSLSLQCLTSTCYTAPNWPVYVPAVMRDP